MFLEKVKERDKWYRVKKKSSIFHRWSNSETGVAHTVHDIFVNVLVEPNKQTAYQGAWSPKVHGLVQLKSHIVAGKRFAKQNHLNFKCISA